MSCSEASDIDYYRAFGTDLALDGDRLLVAAAPGFSPPTIHQVYAAYVFDWNGETWTETAKLPADTTGIPNYKGFASSVAVRGNYAFIGHVRADPTDASPYTLGGGAVDIFEWNGEMWRQVDRLSPEGVHGFGNAVALDGDRLLVSAREHASTSGDAAYVYEWRGERWTLEAKITAVGANPDPTTGRVLFSFYVTLRGDYIFLGVPLDIVDGVMTGSVLAYEHDGTSWVPRARFTPDSNEPHQRFGAGLLATDHGLWVSTEDEIYVYELPQPTNTEATPGTLKQAERSLLRPSYPNPFSTATQIAFELDRPGHVRLSVFDLLGREVEVLAAGLLGSGTHQYHWDAGTRPSGLYLVRLTGDTFAVSQPITLSR